MKRQKSAYRPYGGRREKHLLWWVLLLLLGLGVVLFGAMQVVIAVHDGTHITGEPDMMMIFGCHVKADGPSEMLQSRLDTALSYLEEHPDLPVVVAGGKGDNEHMAEAEAMRDYLVEHGVDAAQITVENRSRNTKQNLLFSRGILVGQGSQPEELHILAVSSGFHLARIEMLAYRFDYGQVSTLAAPTGDLWSSVRMFFREPLALVKSFLLDWE